MKVCVFGLGDGGSEVASDLASAGAEVVAYDPAPVPTPTGVVRLPHPALAAAHSQLILGVTGEVDAELAMLQAIEVFPENALYADFSTSRPALKLELAEVAAAADCGYVDVAPMARGVRQGLGSPTLVSGDGAERYAKMVSQYGATPQVISGEPGAASRRKLLRSTVLAGTAAVMSEAIGAATVTDDLTWLWSTMADDFSAADEAWLRELIVEHRTNSARHVDKVLSAQLHFDDLGTGTTMSAATIAHLRDVSAVESRDLPGDER